MSDCIFCQVAAGTAPSWCVHETEHAYAFLNINPASEYHTLVIPKRHWVNIFDVPQDDLQHVMSAVKHVADLYHRKLDIEHVQIINSSGSEAQQDVFHLHFHIVPRRAGDGQDVQWTIHRELRKRFDEALERLHA